jgi:integrase
MIKPPSPKPGQPRKEVHDVEGNIVPFLGSYERRNKRGKGTKTVYYSWWVDKTDLDKNGKPKWKKHYYKQPYPAVIIEHNQRMASLSNKPIPKIEMKVFDSKFESESKIGLSGIQVYKRQVVAITKDGVRTEVPPQPLELDYEKRFVQKPLFIAEVKKFLSDPVKAAEELGPGWEQVRKLKDLPVGENKVSLQELFDFYIARQHPCGTEKRGQKSAWNFFKAMIGKTFISEVSEVDISNFYTKTCSEAKSRKSVKNENLWISTKFMKIKTVLNTCRKYLIPQNSDVDRVISYWERHIEIPDIEVTDKPRAISKTVFSELVKNSNLKFQTIYSLAVNCFFYAGDFPFLTKDCIFKEGQHTYIRMPRNKEKKRFDRLNCLAPETTKLLAVYLKSEPNDTPFVFNGELKNGKPNGKPISAKAIRIYHQKLCKELNIAGVGFRHCRDAVTHIRKLHPDVQNLSLGHKISDEQRVKYIEDMIEDSIEPMKIIRKTYFMEPIRRGRKDKISI